MVGMEEIDMEKKRAKERKKNYYYLDVYPAISQKLRVFTINKQTIDGIPHIEYPKTQELQLLHTPNTSPSLTAPLHTQRKFLHPQYPFQVHISSPIPCGCCPRHPLPLQKTKRTWIHPNSSPAPPQ